MPPSSYSATAKPAPNTATAQCATKPACIHEENMAANRLHNVDPKCRELLADVLIGSDPIPEILLVGDLMQPDGDLIKIESRQPP